MAETNTTFFLMVLIIAIGSFAIYWQFRRKQQTERQSNVYQEALENTLEGNERVAIQKFKDAIREDSENINAYIHLGDLLRKRGMVPNAIRIHRDLTLRTTLTHTQRVRIQKSLILDYEAANDWEKASKIAQTLLELEKKPDLWLVQKMVDLYEKTGQWKAASELIDKFQKKLSPQYQKRVALYLVFQGLELQEKGSGKEGRVLFKEALKKDSNCAAAYYYLGRSYKQENRLEDAVEYWKKMCFAVPEKSYIVFSDLEKASFEIGRFSDVERHYMEMIDSFKNNLKPGLALTEIYTKKGDFDSALDLLKRLEDEHPDAPELITQKVVVLFNKGQYKQAATQAISLFKENHNYLAPSYQCEKCQYESKEPLWRCPECLGIDTFV
ncbi:MAG: hypothetical protein D6748_05515 [Calditrichaeota bacterium]|nr:MAG: hypothetical protein D6748_05515 [Calditrichota bacterium]